MAVPLLMILIVHGSAHRAHHRVEGEAANFTWPWEKAHDEVEKDELRLPAEYRSKFSCSDIDVEQLAKELTTTDATSVNSTVRTFKASPKGLGAIFKMKDVVMESMGRHQHIRLGKGVSCLDVARQRSPSLETLQSSGCGPYLRTSRAVNAVRDCMDAAGYVERAAVRLWASMAKRYWNANAFASVGLEPSEAWAKLFKRDANRIAQARISSLRLLQPDSSKVWRILERVSVHAFRHWDQHPEFMNNVNRKLAEIDKTFISLLEDPGDLVKVPRTFNSVGAEDGLRMLLEAAVYVKLVDDNSTFYKHVLPHAKGSLGAAANELFTPLLCKGSLDCINAAQAGIKSDPTLLWLMLKHLDDEVVAKLIAKLRLGWMSDFFWGVDPAGPRRFVVKGVQFPAPRSTRAIFEGCFSGQEVDEESRLRDVIAAAKTIFTGKRANVVDREILVERRPVAMGSGKFPLRGAEAVQGALACYPTLFGSVGMEVALRDETGYEAGGRRLEENEEIVAECGVAPVCARLSLERLLHFNIKRWSPLSVASWQVERMVPLVPNRCFTENPKAEANCQLFAGCFKDSVDELCRAAPSCCPAQNSGCKWKRGGLDVLSDVFTVLRTPE